VLESAKRDLEILKVPSWLPEKDFIPWLNTVFRTMPIYQILVERCRASSPFEDKDALEWLASLSTDESFIPRESWEILKAWLRFLESDLMIVPINEAVILARRI